MIVYKWHDGTINLFPQWFQQGLWFEPRQLPVIPLEIRFDLTYQAILISNVYCGSSVERHNKEWNYTSIARILPEKPNARPGKAKRPIKRIRKHRKAKHSYSTNSA